MKPARAPFCEGYHNPGCDLPSFVSGRRQVDAYDAHTRMTPLNVGAGRHCAENGRRVWSPNGSSCTVSNLSMVARRITPPSAQSVDRALHSRRSVIKHGAFAAGALLLPWRPRWAQAQSATFDYYISPTGSDSNPGTQASPWSITAINTKQSVYAGKRVGLLDGTYNVYSLCQAGAWNLAALVVNGGTTGSPTVIAAVNPQKAILDAHDPSSGAYPTTECAIIGLGA